MNYIGSKYSLLGAIRALLADRGIRPPGTFFDAFAGTTIVGQMAKTLGFSTISNDLQAYSQVLARAFLVNNDPPRFAGLDLSGGDSSAFLARTSPFGVAKGAVDIRSGDFAPLVRVLAYLDGLPGTAGAFTEAYVEGGSAGRLYFSRANGMRCQAIRDQISGWQREGAITDLEAAILVASLLESLDQVANTASVYAAYLKHLKGTAQARMTLRVPALIFGDAVHEAYIGDTNALADQLAGREIAVMYVDPPYNQRQYNSYYHILETVASWDLDAFVPRGKTGLRPARRQDSQYCRRPQAADALFDLVERVPADQVIVSYNDEGLVDRDQLRALLGRRSTGDDDFREFSYRRFRADADGPTRSYSGSEVFEYLYAIRTRRQAVV